VPNLTPNFTTEQLCFSDTASRLGIDNTAPDYAVFNLLLVAEALEWVQTRLGHPLIIHSGYRSAALNKAVNGVNTSAHCFGLAVDFTCPKFGTPYQVATKIAQCSCPTIDQLIREYGWVHIGLADAHKNCAFGSVFGRIYPRRMLLTKRSASSPYEQGILE
jgi:zinc D-Ala-D-Ala carboxypeptidase